MLVPRHNTLSSDELITCERTMLKFIDNKLSEDTGMHFNVWKWTIPELYGILLGMLVKLDLVGTLDIRKSEMLDFIIDVEKGYNITSYHSFLHAVDVVVVLYYMLTDLGAAKYITSLDAICLLIAGLCHDIGHPGLNNVYQVNARTGLAVRYNDLSVLENYSCDLTMDIITKHKIFRHVHNCDNEYLGCDPKEVDTSLKSLITKTILATDMMFHFDLLESLHEMIGATSSSSCFSEESGEEMDNSYPSSLASSVSSISSLSSSPVSMSPPKQNPISENTNDEYVAISRSSSRSSTSSMIVSLDSDQRELLLKVLIHAADLSNTVRPWEISKLWSDRVVDEFFRQGDLEKENNLPVSPNMDREQSHQCQISLGFGDFVVRPYFETFAKFLSPATIFLKILANNRVCWDEMKNAPPPKITTPDILTTDYSDKSLCPDYAVNSSKGQRRVSLAAGLVIIPEDIQEKLRLMTSPRSPRHRRLKRSLSGRSYSHHSFLPTRSSFTQDDYDDDYRKTRRKSAGPDAILDVVDGDTPNFLLPISHITEGSSSPALSSTSSYTSSAMTYSLSNNTTSACSHHQRRIHGRVRRSSSLDHNMIRQITSLYGSGDTPTSEHRVVMAGS
ncbi:675_t:CDS:2 [Funneliformis geosporum]|uniref:Phosphodiesterase n=1 Tax=Funneliformis geosporum TaxID=1117311 RepID=A0A9W4WRP0_9GLOM|nr:675_t:CDS:2 [Funneliformis geosporum]CAI2173870.1 3842_t:CDS:2 [Funneliformis geosporum]